MVPVSFQLPSAIWTWNKRIPCAAEYILASFFKYTALALLFVASGVQVSFRPKYRKNMNRMQGYESLRLIVVHARLNNGILFSYIKLHDFIINLGGVYTKSLLWKTDISELTTYPWKSCRLSGSFTLIRPKRATKATTFESGNKSVYFEYGTKSHLPFSSCKLNSKSGFETSKLRYRTWLSLRLAHALKQALRSRDYRCCRLARIHLIRV